MDLESQHQDLSCEAVSQLPRTPQPAIKVIMINIYHVQWTAGLNVESAHREGSCPSISYTCTMPGIFVLIDWLNFYFVG